MFYEGTVIKERIELVCNRCSATKTSKKSKENVKGKKKTDTESPAQTPPLKNISTGIGFLLNPLLALLNALSSLPASLIVGVTLPRLLTPSPWCPYPITITSDSRLE